MRSGRIVAAGVAFALTFGALAQVSAANPRPGAVCSKAGKKQVFAGKTFTCVKKKGKGFVWNKGVKVVAAPLPTPSPISTPSTTPSAEASPSPSPTPTQTLYPSPTPTPTPTTIPLTFAEKLWSRAVDGVFPIEKEVFEIPTELPSNWQDVYEKRLGIPYKAWLQISQNIAQSPSKLGNVELFIGPNTTPNFPDLKLPMELVSKAFPSARNVKNVRVFAFNFKDADWADQTLKRVFAGETEAFKKRHWGAVNESCPKAREVCFQQAFIDSNLDGVILIGMVDKGSREESTHRLAEHARAFRGVVIGHEYLHTIQRIILGERWFQRIYTPPSWFNEGSAVFTENAAVNHASFNSFMHFRLSDSSVLYSDCPYNFCVKLDEKLVIEYLSLSHYSTNWDNFPYAMKYSMSARLIEILVALKGPESIITLIEQMATAKTFDQAFEVVYGISYESAKPIIARIIVDQFQNSR